VEKGVSESGEEEEGIDARRWVGGLSSSFEEEVFLLVVVRVSFFSFRVLFR